MIKTVILDLDDTLCMTEQVCFELENEVLKQMGQTQMSREVHRANWGKPLFTAILERSPGIDLEEFKRIYAKTLPQYTATGQFINIPKKNIRALKLLKAKHKSLIVLTSRTAGEMEELLEGNHELSEYIDAYYYFENMEYHKPDPRAFEHIEKEHGSLPTECVYVGDSTIDAVAANGAGLHFIACLESGLRQREDFVEHQVDVFIEHFPDVVDAVKEIDESLL